MIALMSCLFCKIISGEIPASKVYEDEHTLAFMDIGHVNPVHTLVAVKKHAANLYELDETQAAPARRAAEERPARKKRLRAVKSTWP